MNAQRVLTILKQDEGRVVVNGKHVAYQDSSGYWTLGYGLLIDEKRNGGLSEFEATWLLDRRMNLAYTALMVAYPWYGELSPVRKEALVCMVYQLGEAGFRGFKKMLRALAAGNFDLAADEALDSKWANVDSPERAARVAYAIRVGKWKGYDLKE